MVRLVAELNDSEWDFNPQLLHACSSASRWHLILQIVITIGIFKNIPFKSFFRLNLSKKLCSISFKNVKILFHYRILIVKFYEVINNLIRI